jgi:hypothetical protein
MHSSPDQIQQCYADTVTMFESMTRQMKRLQTTIQRLNDILQLLEQSDPTKTQSDGVTMTYPSYMADLEFLTHMLAGLGCNWISCHYYQIQHQRKFGSIPTPPSFSGQLARDFQESNLRYCQEVINGLVESCDTILTRYDHFVRVIITVQRRFRARYYAPGRPGARRAQTEFDSHRQVEIGSNLAVAIDGNQG